MKILRALSLSLIASAVFAQSQTQFGEFSVSNAGGKVILEISPKVVQGTFQGPALTLKSRQKVRDLELNARKMWGTSDRMGAFKNLLTRATLTGSVRVRITELATGEMDIVTAERVEYKIGATKNTGHADLVGKTTWKRLDKARQPILTVTGENGTIDFDGDTQTISLDNMDGNMTPPANKDKGKQ